MIGLQTTGTSYWMESTRRKPDFPELWEDITVDVVVIGGGITGLTAAYLLKSAGKKVAVLEKNLIGSGVTGFTTGKVTSQHNLIYNKLYSQKGRVKAQHYAQANQAAVELIQKIVAKEHIDCDWHMADNYVFTTNYDQIPLFKKEADVAKLLGLPADYVAITSLPFAVQAAVKFSNQASMHARKYLLGLADVVYGDGSYVFENTRALRMINDSKNLCKVPTKDGCIRAKNVIIATHVPLPVLARGSYCALEYPSTSYIVAFELNQQLDGMYISPDKIHYSILPVTQKGQSLLLIGGQSHIPMYGISKEKRYENLIQYGKKHFNVQDVVYRWAAYDYIGYDDLPLVGKLYPWSKNVYTATGYRKWGLTNGTVAAVILSETILGRKNKWAKTFSTQRISPILSIPRVLTEHVFG